MRTQRSPQFRNAPSEMAKTAGAASKAAIFAYDLEDFLRDASTRLSIDPSATSVEIDVSTWSDLWRRSSKKKEVGREAVQRRWERWKGEIEEFGIGRRTGGQFWIDRAKAAEWIEEAIQRGNKLADAYTMATGRKMPIHEVPTSRVERALSTADIAVEIGVTPHAVYAWVEEGAPHTRGKRDVLAFNLNEIKAWLANRMDTSRRFASHHESRIQSEEGSRRLLAVRDTLRLSNRVFAGHLGVALNTLTSWLQKTVETVPSTAVAQAELMLMERGISPQDAAPGQRVERMPQSEAGPRLKAVREALNMSTAVLAETLGVQAVTLKTWMGTGGKIAKAVPTWVVEGAEKLVETTEPRVYRSTRAKLADPKRVRAAFEQARGGLSAAARILGVTESAAKTAAVKLGIETRAPVVLTEVVSAENLQDALERHGGNATAAAEELGVDRTSTVRLAEKFGLGDLVRKQPAPLADRISEEDLRAALERHGGNATQAAKDIGVPRESLTRFTKERGLESLTRRKKRLLVTREDLLAALARSGGSPSGAADELGIKRGSIYRLVKLHGLEDLANKAGPPASERITKEALRESLERHSGNVSQVAREIGLTGNTTRRLVIEHGLEDLARHKRPRAP